MVYGIFLAMVGLHDCVQRIADTITYVWIQLCFLNQAFNNPVLLTNLHKNAIQSPCKNVLNNPGDLLIWTISWGKKMCGLSRNDYTLYSHSSLIRFFPIKILCRIINRLDYWITSYTAYSIFPMVCFKSV